MPAGLFVTPRHELRPGGRRPRPRQRRAHRGRSPPPPRGGHRAGLARTARGGACTRREGDVGEARCGAARGAPASVGDRSAAPGRGGGRDRRLVEVGFGLGLTTLLIAASLTSLPRAVDVVADRATLTEVAARLTPRWPTLSSPAIDELPVDDRAAPRTAADRAWSEFNHNVAGLFVLAMGLLAILHAAGRARWARHWPLIFLGLAVFLMIRDDPGAWPLGPLGFWESWAYPAVFQHRVFVLLVIVFAAFEWMVRAGRVSSRRAALVFPLLCAVGGGLLLTPSHASLGLQGEFLTEGTHAPPGLLGMLVGWARWLERRL